MTDAEDAPADGRQGERRGPERGDGTGEAAAGAGADGEDEMAALRRRVEEKYDFEDFGPADMAEMSYEEWDAAFDHESWITDDELLDRVEADLAAAIANRDVFARLERVADGDGECLVAYSDEGYAVVYPDGSVEGRGTVLRDVKPVVALCSMESYDPDEPPAGDPLPDPAEVPQGTGELGNLVLQVVGGANLLAGVGLIGAWLLYELNLVAPIAALFFLFIGAVLFTVVANARLSDRFRSEEYRERLRTVGGSDPPEFVPLETGPDGSLRLSRRGEDAPAATGSDSPPRRRRPATDAEESETT